MKRVCDFFPGEDRPCIKCPFGLMPVGVPCPRFHTEKHAIAELKECIANAIIFIQKLESKLESDKKER